MKSSRSSHTLSYWPINSKYTCSKSQGYLHRQGQRKILISLRSSKTRGKESKLQSVKISKLPPRCQGHDNFERNSVPCPYALLKSNAQMRGPYVSHQSEQFFVFADGSKVLPSQARTCLKKALKLANFDAKYYSFHSLRSGRTHDLLECGLSIVTKKKLGRWRSNAIYKYLK